MSDDSNDNAHAAINQYVSHLIQGGQRKSSDELLNTALNIGASLVPGGELAVAAVDLARSAMKDDDED